MNEAERRAAFEAAVVEALTVLLFKVVATQHGNLSGYEALHRAVANVRTLHETVIDSENANAPSRM